MITFILVYLLIINITGGGLMVMDKHRAVKKAWRIPESNLLFLCSVGGFFGIYCAMKFARHKTKHWQFHTLVIISGFAWLIALPLCWFIIVTS